MADKEPTERRVYVLPTEQLERIRAYQAADGIASEVEAVRRLLDAALQMRDTIPDLLKKLKSRFANERDLKVLGREILASHTLVKSINFGDKELTFSFAGDDYGKIDSKGTTYVSGSGQWDDWNVYPPAQKGSAPSWDAPKPKLGDLDDEIPF